MICDFVHLAASMKRPASAGLGSLKAQGHITEKKTGSSQVTDLIYLKESDSVMALCDQWWTPDNADINRSRFLFLPLNLDFKTGKVAVEYREKWKPLRPRK